MPRRTTPLILALGLVACAAVGCSGIEVSDSGNPLQAMQTRAHPYTQADCFYSDVFETDTAVAGRAPHWCGPEPKALN
jgi:hypothetical protein